MEHKYDVFISYSRKDIEEVTQLVDMLKKRIPTLNCWFDITGIECGDEEFDEKIVKIIDNSSYVLFALSKNSMESKWAKDEVMYAKNVGKKVIPVLLDGAKLEGWFLFKFGRVDCIDSTKDIQIDKMMKNISKWTKKPILKKKEVEQHEGENVKKIISDVKHPTPKPSYTKYILGVLAVVLGVVIGVVMTGDEPVPEPVVAENEPVAEEAVVDRGTIRGHDWVDLGLSVKWATCNVGASQPHGYGNYYAWGETSTKSKYTKENSRTYHENMSDISGNSNYDVARSNWGDSWRMPTNRELTELRQNCIWTWTSQSGVNGYKVTGLNGNSIFLPAAGYCLGSSRYYVGESGYFWSSTPDEGDAYGAYCLNFGSGSHGVGWDSRDCGYTVRPVSE